MKNYYLLSITFLLFFHSKHLKAQSFSQFRQGDSIVAGIGCSQGFSQEYKFKPKDIDSYKHLGKDFGKDKFQVYYKGNTIEKIDATKAEIVFAKDKQTNDAWYRNNNLFLTDGNVTYYDDVLMQNADAKNIFYITDNRIPLFRSNNNIYFQGYWLDKLNADSTYVIDSHPNEEINFFTDGKNVYKNEIWVENADAKTFQRRGYGNIADSRDNKRFYSNGKTVFPYSDWKETKLFPDSIYTKNHFVTFISTYETQNSNSNPPIDFYLSDNDFEKLTKHIVLQRKTELNLEKEPFINQVKGYKIQVFKNKELESVFYYAQDLEEWDIYKTTQVEVIGDGFQLSNKEFDFFRSKGKSIKYLEEKFENYQDWQQKITALSNSEKVIYLEPNSYYLSPIDKEGKQWKRPIYEYWLDNNNQIRSQLSSYEGLFTFKIEREKSAKIMNGDIGEFSTEERQEKKIELAESLFGKENYFIHLNDNIESINNEQWLTFDIYCSERFMEKVAKEYIQNNWQKITHNINWAEK